MLDASAILMRIAEHTLSANLTQAESFVGNCYAGSRRFYGDVAGVDFCVQDCDPASKIMHTLGMHASYF